jgi:acylpyruvate hydrolase
MRFASVLHDDVPLAVVIDGHRAVPLPGVDELGLANLIGVLDASPPGAGSDALALGDLRLRPVIPRPAKVICVGLNYVAHVNESRGDLPDYPVLFTKFARSLTGARDDIPCPSESAAIDYEGELAVVIGRPARRVAPDAAMGVIAGYAVANDISMRDFQNRTHQWLQGKAWDASTPVGPYLVTAEEVGDPGALTLRTIVNGQVVQEASTAQLIFDIPTLVSRISEFTTLEPGDLILTGTPGGVGFRREPPLLLGPGDVVAVEIDRVGRIENTMVAEEG